MQRFFILAIYISTAYSQAGAQANTQPTTQATGQPTINSYKYVLVPKKFDFLSSADEYALNTMTKSLLELKGFTVLWTNADLPQAIIANKCAALTAEVTEKKSFFTTTLFFTLKDCYGNIVFKGKEGKSREKEYDVAYREALRDAFSTLGAFPYKYDSTGLTPAPAIVQAPTQQPTGTQSAATTQTAPSSTSTTPPTQTPRSTAAAPQASGSPRSTATDAPGTLYAQAIPNGYQLIDITPKKVMTLLKTSLPDCYLAQPAAETPATPIPGAQPAAPGVTASPTAIAPSGPTPNGIVFKNNGEWVFEYYKDGTLISQKLMIKF